MSGKWIAVAWSADGLSALQKLVLLRLAWTADATGESFAGRADLCEALQASDKSVRAALRTLEKLGWIKRGPLGEVGWEFGWQLCQREEDQP